MSALQELRDAIDHVTACTGDGGAWRRGLSPAELTTISAAVIDPAAVSGLLAKIRAHNAPLFDPSTGTPIFPEPGGTGQRGDAATAMKKAEADLAQQNSAAAQLDLHVVSAILNAHAKTVDGGARLQRLQQEVEAAVRGRTDLDTPAGARDFQRFLIGKLREIGAVVESAGLDDSSKAALASAWTALYNTGSTAGTGVTATDQSGPSEARAAATPDAAPAASAAPDPLPPYGSDLGSDPLLDSLLAQETAPSNGGAGTVPSSPMAAPTAPAGVPPLGMPTLPNLAAAPLPAGAPAELSKSEGALPQTELTETDQLPPDDWLDPLEDPLGEPLDESPSDDETDDETDPDAPADATEPTAVRLPDGSSVQAPTPVIASVLRSAIAGTPIVEAFRAEGVTVPPPGTPVPHPVDVRQLVGGDIGMFMDRQALAVSGDRALFGGRIQPVSSVGGPSFLGWLHPQGEDTAPPAPPSTPMQGGTPPPTRPATAAAR